MVEQVIDGVLEGAGEELAGELDGEEPRTRVDVLAAGHGRGAEEASSTAAERIPRLPSEFPHGTFSAGSFYSLVGRQRALGGSEFRPATGHFVTLARSA